jgi:lipoprotein signal peptidase
MAERSYRKLFWGLAAVGLVLDQATKYGVFRWLYDGTEHSERAVVPGVFDLMASFTKEEGSGVLRTWSAPHLPQVNHGALFGFLSEHVGLANVLFAVISLAAAVAITWWSARPTARRELGLSAALGLILAGTLGNLFDRLVFGGVRDFMHLHYQSFDWPVFNVADCCLVIGAFLLLGQAFFGKSAARSPATAPAAPQEMAEAR